MLRELRGRDRSPTRVIHLWTRGIDDEESTVVLGLHSLVALTRAAGEVGLGDWSLDIITSGSARPRPNRGTACGLP